MKPGQSCVLLATWRFVRYTLLLVSLATAGAGVRYVDYETDRHGGEITVCTADKLYPLVSRIEARRHR